MKLTAARSLLGGIVAAGAITGGVVYNQVAGTYETLGASLVASGYSVAVSKVAGLPVEVGPVDASAPLDWENYGAGTDAAAFDRSFFARYRMHTGSAYGSPARGMTCRPQHSIDVQTLAQIVRHPSNPLRISDNQAWEAGRTDLEDLRWLTSPGRGCDGLVIDEAIFPAGCRVGVLTVGCPSTPPTPTPEPTPTQTPEPTSTPEPPPTWRYGWAVRQVDCIGGAPNSLCLDLRFSPSIVSTGQATVAVE